MPHAFDAAPASDSVMRQLVRAVVDTPATIEDYQKLAEIVQVAREHGLGTDQVAAQIGKTPFAWLIRMLPENKDQAYSFIQIVVSILAIIITLASTHNPQAPVSVTPDQEKRIIEQLKEQFKDQTPPAEPIPTDSPTDEKPAGCQ